MIRLMTRSMTRSITTSATLVHRSLSRHRWIIIGLGAVLSLFQLMNVVIARNLEREGLFSQLAALVPPFVQEALGSAAVASFAGLLSFGFVHPVVVLSLALCAVYLASEPAAEVEEGLVDLIASRPVPRHAIVTRSIVVAFGATAGIIVLMVVVSRAALAVFAPAAAPVPRLSATLAVAANLAALVWCFGSAGLAVAARATRRVTAVGTVGLAAVTLYMVHFAAASWAPARPLDLVSPFHYYEGLRVLMGTTNPLFDTAVLLAATAALSGLAYVLYERRDL